MIGDKWYESIQHFQSPYPLNAAFRKEAYSGHFYLAYTPMIFFQHQRNAASWAHVDDTKPVVSFKMKDIVNAFADLKDDLHRIGQWCSNNLLLLNSSKTKLMVFGSRQMRS